MVTKVKTNSPKSPAEKHCTRKCIKTFWKLTETILIYPLHEGNSQKPNESVQQENKEML